MTSSVMLAGGTHPSFSDVHLILPKFVNTLMGLRGTPERILECQLHASLEFIQARGNELEGRCDLFRGHEKGHKLTRPIGIPGRMMSYEIRRDTDEAGEGTKEL